MKMNAIFSYAASSLHPSLRFTFEKESNLALHFLNVLVEKSSKFISSIYTKSSFTVRYLRWNSFSPQNRETNFILTLTHRALAICSAERLLSERNKIKFILQSNGYRKHAIKSFMAKKMQQFHALLKFESERCPVYLRLPWLGSVFTQFEKQVRSAMKQCFSAVEPRVVYSTNELLSATNKDVLSALRKSNVIYQLSCHCDSRYVRRNSRRLQNRIQQHVPKPIRSCSSSQKCVLPAPRCKSSTQTNTQSLTSDSAIGLHLLQNHACPQLYDDSRFSILAQGCSHFHLSAAVFFLFLTFFKKFSMHITQHDIHIYVTQTNNTNNMHNVICLRKAAFTRATFSSENRHLPVFFLKLRKKETRAIEKEKRRNANSRN